MANFKAVGPGTMQSEKQSSEDFLDLKGLFGIARRRKWLVLGLVALGTSAAWIFGLNRVPVYTAIAEVVVDSPGAQAATLPRWSPLQADISALMSPRFAARLVDDLDLVHHADFMRQAEDAAAGSGPDLTALVTHAKAAVPQGLLAALGLGDPQGVVDRDARKYATSLVLERFDARQHENSFIISFSFTSPDPEMAARVADRAAELYVQGQRDRKVGRIDRAAGWMGDRIEELRRQLMVTETEVERFKASHNLVDGTRGETLGGQELADLSKSLTAARTELVQNETRLTLLRGVRRKGNDLDALIDVVSSPVLTSLRDQEASLLTQEAETATSFGERHPRMMNLRNEKTNLADKINREVDRVIGTIETNVRLAKAQMLSLEESLGRLKKRSGVDREAEVRLRELEREANSTKELYESLLTRVKAVDEQRDLLDNDARVVSRPAVPELPSSAGPQRYALGGFMGSFMVGGLLALLLELLDGRPRTSGHVERQLGLPALAFVPETRSRRKDGGRIHHSILKRPLSVYAESIRTIYAALKLDNAGIASKPKVVLVTSALPNEGKTTLTASLATLAAASGARTIVVDVDMRRPNVAAQFGVQVSADLTDFLVGGCAWDEAIYKDPVSGVDCLPVCHRPSNPLALLTSPNMGRAINELRQRYDLILLDGPPVIGLTDARVTAPLADTTLFAMRWNTTYSEAARRGIKELRASGAPIAGVAVTVVNMKTYGKYNYHDFGKYTSEIGKYYST